MWEFSECFAECSLSFDYVEWMSEDEKTIIKNIIEIAERNLDGVESFYQSLVTSY